MVNISDFHNTKQELEQMDTVDLRKFLNESGALDKAKNNLLGWLDTPDWDEKSLKFKATELVLKMSGLNNSKKKD